MKHGESFMTRPRGKAIDREQALGRLAVYFEMGGTGQYRTSLLGVVNGILTPITHHALHCKVEGDGEIVGWGLSHRSEVQAESR